MSPETTSSSGFASWSSKSLVAPALLVDRATSIGAAVIVTSNIFLHTELFDVGALNVAISSFQIQLLTILSALQCVPADSDADG